MISIIVVAVLLIGYSAWQGLGFVHQRREVVDDREQKQTNGTSIQRQQELIQHLKPYASKHANVGILFANVKHRPLAEALISIFELAGWQTDLTKVPLESYGHEYIEGIEVLGYNKHLVEAVAAFLRKAGLSDVRVKIETHNIKPDNPKYPSVQQSIKITVGHQS